MRKPFPNLNITYVNGPYEFSKDLQPDPVVKELIKSDKVYSWLPMPID